MSPTVREIGDEFGIASPNGVICHLTALERKGWITVGQMQARSIRVPGLDVMFSQDEEGRMLAALCQEGVEGSGEVNQLGGDEDGQHVSEGAAPAGGNQDVHVRSAG